MDLLNCSVHPGKEFLFGTDTMGRDIFSMIWSGGRISLTIGVLASLIAAAIAILYGAVSGCAPAWLDELLMRLSEIFLSVPNLLLVILLQAAFGKAGVFSLSVVIGATSWAGMAKVVRTEVRRPRREARAARESPCAQARAARKTGRWLKKRPLRTIRKQSGCAFMQRPVLQCRKSVTQYSLLKSKLSGVGGISPCGQERPASNRS